MPSDAFVLPEKFAPVGHSSGPSVAAPRHHEALQLLDDPHEWSAFSRVCGPDPALWESSVVIEGMHCAACSMTVEDALSRVPGVVSAQVSAGSHRARVVWSSSMVSPSQWMQAVLDSGYRAVPANDMFAAENARSRPEKPCGAGWSLVCA